MAGFRRRKAARLLVLGASLVPLAAGEAYRLAIDRRHTKV